MERPLVYSIYLFMVANMQNDIKEISKAISCLSLRIGVLGLESISLLFLMQSLTDWLTWNDDIAEAEHGHVGGAEPVLEEVLREDELDGRLEALGDGDHHVGAEDLGLMII